MNVNKIDLNLGLYCFSVYQNIYYIVKNKMKDLKKEGPEGIGR